MARVNRICTGLAVLMLGGCAVGAPTPEARAQVAATLPDSTAGQVIQPVVSRPIIGPDGNSFQCTAYPGGGAGGVCVQR